jgi:hypothetical protein
MLIPVLRICVVFLVYTIPTRSNAGKVLCCYERQSNSRGLADKCNKDQLKTYPPEDGLIKEAETCSGD